MTHLQRLLAVIQSRQGDVPGAPPAFAASTGGTLAPDAQAPVVTGQEQQPVADGSQAGDPLANLVAGFQKYARLHGQGGEKLQELAQGHRTAAGFLQGVGTGQAVRQITDPSQQGLAQIGRVNQSGNVRNGLAFQTYDLGNGQMAHVYYDPKSGRRQVVKFRKGT